MSLCENQICNYKFSSIFLQILKLFDQIALLAQHLFWYNPMQSWDVVSYWTTDKGHKQSDPLCLC